MIMKKNKRKINKRARVLKAGSITAKLLLTIGRKIKEIGENFLEFSPDSFWYPDIARSLYTIAPKKIYASYHVLKNGGYIKEKETRKGKVIYLTDKGKMEILKNEFWKEKKKWDGKWRIIIFDIPENSRKHRNFLRRKLQWFGFRELQKSVWIIPYDARREFKEFLKLCNIKLEGDVRYLVVEKVDPAIIFKDHFKNEKE